MHEYPLSCFVRDRFVEMVEDVMGTDGTVAITDEGRVVAVVIDPVHLAELRSLVEATR